MNIPELPPATFLQYDLFPAKVLTQQGEFDRVRFVVTDAHIHIFKLTPTGDIELVFTDELVSIIRAPEVGTRGVKAMGAHEGVVEAQKSLNCGCGMSRIKTAKFFNPLLPLQALPY